MQEAVRQVAQPVGGIVLLYAAALAGVHADARRLDRVTAAGYIWECREKIDTDSYACAGTRAQLVFVDNHSFALAQLMQTCPKYSEI
jgi:hypothetical protein